MVWAPPDNVAPAVNAGADQTIGLPAGATLTGGAKDDGLPVGGGLLVTWTRQSGPGTVTFAKASSASTTATFAQPGTYILRLTAHDGQLSSFDEVTVIVNPVIKNLAPTVDAGLSQTITLPGTAALAGQVADDGLPVGSTVTTAWTPRDGPGTVSFASPASLATTATFSRPGTYTLQLAASDGAQSAAARVTVTVLPEPNDAPVVNAGSDQQITAPDGVTLIGTATDDGAPIGSVLSTMWTRHVRTQKSNFSSIEVPAAGGPFTSPGQVVDFTLGSTASVLRGTVSDSDGTPVAGAAVNVRQPGAEGGIEYFYSEPTGPDGQYLLFGVEPRAFVVQARDAEPGMLNTEVAAVLDAPSVVLNVSLPQAGSVFVNTLGEGSTVTLTSNASEPGVYAWATVDPDLGGALLSRVPSGPFAVQVCYAETPLACVAGSGNLQPSGAPLVVEVAMPNLVPDGFVGTLVAPDGITPVANEYVLVTAGEATPASGAEYVVTDGAGQFRATVPIVAQGLLVASGWSPFALSVQNGTDVGPLTFNLVLGSGIDASSNTLTGALSLRYTFSLDGSVQGGASPEISGAFEWYNGLRLNGLGLGGHWAASTELAGRQIAYAPATMGGLQVTRKVYVPEDGSYARYLEVLHNPTGGAIAGPITTDLQLVGQLAEPFRVVRSTSDTGGAYFITDDGGIGSGRTVMADVLSANTGAASLFASVRMQLFGGYTTKRYTVTVPDGETRILMHFVVQRLAGNQAGAEAQALSLVDLTDPNMFFGLSAAERAQVVNFRVP